MTTCMAVSSLGTGVREVWLGRQGQIAAAQCGLPVGCWSPYVCALERAGALLPPVLAVGTVGRLANV